MSNFECTGCPQISCNGYYQNLKDNSIQYNSGRCDQNENRPNVNNNKRRLIKADLEHFKDSTSCLFKTMEKNNVNNNLIDECVEPYWKDCKEDYVTICDLSGGCDQESSSPEPTYEREICPFCNLPKASAVDVKNQRRSSAIQQSSQDFTIKSQSSKPECPINFCGKSDIFNKNGSCPKSCDQNSITEKKSYQANSPGNGCPCKQSSCASCQPPRTSACNQSQNGKSKALSPCQNSQCPLCQPPPVKSYNLSSNGNPDTMSSCKKPSCPQESINSCYTPQKENKCPPVACKVDKPYKLTCKSSKACELFNQQMSNERCRVSKTCCKPKIVNAPKICEGIDGSSICSKASRKPCDCDENKGKTCGAKTDVYQEILQRCADMEQKSSCECRTLKPITDKDLCNEAYALLQKIYEHMTGGSPPCNKPNLKPPGSNKCNFVGVDVLFERSGKTDMSLKSSAEPAQLSQSLTQQANKCSIEEKQSIIKASSDDNNNETKLKSDSPDTPSKTNAENNENNMENATESATANDTEERESLTSRRRSTAGSESITTPKCRENSSKQESCFSSCVDKSPNNTPYLNLTITCSPGSDKNGVASAKSYQMQMDGSDKKISNCIDMNNNQKQCSQQCPMPSKSEILCEFIDEVFDDLRKMRSQCNPCCAYSTCCSSCCPPRCPPIKECFMESICPPPLPPPLRCPPSCFPPQCFCPPPLCCPPSACCAPASGLKIQSSFPVSIQSVRSLGSCSLLVQWAIHDCSGIGGYEISVDGCTTNRFYSAKHESAVIYGVNINKKHIIILYVIPEFGGCDANQNGDSKSILPANAPQAKASTPGCWCPSVFTYFPC